MEQEDEDRFVIEVLSNLVLVLDTRGEHLPVILDGEERLLAAVGLAASLNAGRAPQRDLMYTEDMNINKLTPAARAALVNTRSKRQGEKVIADPVVITELYDQGLIGEGDGLTRSGTIARERAVSTALEEAFR